MNEERKNQQAAAEPSLSEILQVRRDKLKALQDAGRDPFTQTRFARSAYSADIKNDFDAYDGKTLQAAGRIMSKRGMGKAIFCDIQDDRGQIQLYVRKDAVTEQEFADFRKYDIGDIIGVRGYAFKTKTGEISIHVQQVTLLSKSLRPLPEKFHGMTNTELRYRQRYVDLIMNPESKRNFQIRSQFVAYLRRYLDGLGFMEVETPMLMRVHGGAAARPFTTHINAYDLDLYLRIAPELYLKRAVVGGIDKVFEINRNFRNEGADSSHNPEFTMIEVYEAYGTYQTMADLTREMIQRAALDAFGTLQVTLVDGTVYDFSGVWKQIGFYDSLSEALGETVSPETSRARLEELADSRDIDVEDHHSDGHIAEMLFEDLVADHIYEPTFVIDFPAETSPLTREHRSVPGVAEKWDLYVRGFELATAYSEQTDPVIQRQKFEEQALAAAKGDPEAMSLDEDFLEAMDHGMPPAGGMGMGLDRLLMAFTGQGIRETILFPLVKPLA